MQTNSSPHQYFAQLGSLTKIEGSESLSYLINSEMEPVIIQQSDVYKISLIQLFYYILSTQHIQH